MGTLPLEPVTAGCHDAPAGVDQDGIIGFGCLRARFSARFSARVRTGFLRASRRVLRSLGIATPLCVKVRQAQEAACQVLVRRGR
jgi:hypothetical protein